MIRQKRKFLQNIRYLQQRAKLDLLKSQGYTREKLEQKIQRITDIEREISGYNKKMYEKWEKEYADFFAGRKEATGGSDTHPLDKDQIKAVLSDEMHQLLVAGAGSGKTAVLCAKAAFLMRRDKNFIPPKRILMLAFNRSAADKILEKMQNIYGFNKNALQVYTFHSFGLKCISQLHKYKSEVMGGEKAESEPERIFYELVKGDKVFQKKVLTYTTDHMAEDERQENFLTREKYVKAMEKRDKVSLLGVRVKSASEKKILDFFCRNDIRVEYEKEAKWAVNKTDEENRKEYRPDFYLPDYDIYLECWGISRNGKVPDFFRMDAESYKKGMEWKQKVFAENEKKLAEIYCFETEQDNFEDILKQRLAEKCPHINFNRLSDQELVEKVCAHKDNAIAYLHKELITKAVNKLQSQNRSPEEFIQDFERERDNYTTKQVLFGEIVIYYYKTYEEYKQKERKIDFNDMINICLQLLKENPKALANEYDYILVDEFQDISATRLDILKQFVHQLSETKLCAVGDDWQSIYGFTGSEVNYFTDFATHFGELDVNHLQTNYRSNKTIIEASCNLIAQNKEKVDKKVKPSPSRIDEEREIKVIEFSYSPNKEELKNTWISREIIDIYNQNPNKTILILARYKNSLKRLTDIFDPIKTKAFGEKKLKQIQFKTIHEAKGGEADFVFVLDLVDGSFPSTVENDIVFEIIEGRENRLKRLEEERRLFYVALTRSKEYVYLITDEDNYSVFLDEIHHKYKKIETVKCS